ncbi:RlmF-related methyltransferase, partial [Flavobacteriaceae bacterium]|nr:RlmF-related methyltransferase [Flavobacteriaceae bacterium]
MKRFATHHPQLLDHIILNPSGEETIDFSNSTAVYELNKAMLLMDFKVDNYELPMGYLIPPIPGRLDYLLHLQAFFSKQFNIDKNTKLRGLDIGAGANGIFCVLGS